MSKGVSATTRARSAAATCGGGLQRLQRLQTTCGVVWQPGGMRVARLSLKELAAAAVPRPVHQPTQMLTRTNQFEGRCRPCWEMARSTELELAGRTLICLLTLGYSTSSRQAGGNIEQEVRRRGRRPCAASMTAATI